MNREQQYLVYYLRIFKEPRRISYFFIIRIEKKKVPLSLIKMGPFIKKKTLVMRTLHNITQRTCL